MRKFNCCLIFVLSLISFSIKDSLADLPSTIPPRPCDFYGREQSPNTIRTGSVITAKTPSGTIIGQFTVTTNGQYGFLTTRADDPNTPEIEGAINLDTITFYIDGVKQQKQAIWKSAETIRVDLGIATVEDTFNLHLLDIPGYSNYQGNANFSGVAVADMIIDYLLPTNTDDQQALMTLADVDADGVVSFSELERLLNQRVGGGYNFSSTTTVNQYANFGIIDHFDARNQSDCIKQICHWLAYKVPNAPLGREYVPVAIATSANPASNADSDFRHWMSVVGIKTNQDPFPNLASSASFREEYRAASSLQLFGVYLNDPGQSGLGFHTYMAADLWARQYFRPIATALEGAGTYVAIMEPPAPEAVAVNVNEAKKNTSLQVVLEIPQKGISIFIPKSLDRKTKDYLITLLKQLRQSSDFTSLAEDTYFGQALKDTQVNRCFKVAAGKLKEEYTIIPFDKKAQNKLITPLAVMVNNKTGQFQIATADNKTTSIYNPMPWYQAYKALRKEIGWGEYPVRYWLSSNTGIALYPGWSVVTHKYNHNGPVQVLSSNEYAISADGKVNLEKSSPAVEILSTKVFPSGREWIKMVSFKVDSKEDYSVRVDKRPQPGRVFSVRNQDTWLVVLRGPKEANCKIEVKDEYPTYIYIRR